MYCAEQRVFHQCGVRLGSAELFGRLLCETRRSWKTAIFRINWPFVIKLGGVQFAKVVFLLGKTTFVLWLESSCINLLSRSKIKSLFSIHEDFKRILGHHGFLSAKDITRLSMDAKNRFSIIQREKKMKKTNIAKDLHTMTCISCTCLIGSSVFSFSEWSRLLRRFWKQSAHTNSPRQIRLRRTPTLISTIMLVPAKLMKRQVSSFRDCKRYLLTTVIAREKAEKNIRSLPQWARWRGAVVGFDQ